jgi:hypothetical protein
MIYVDSKQLCDSTAREDIIVCVCVGDNRGFSKILFPPDDYSTKATQKYFKNL